MQDTCVNLKEDSINVSKSWQVVKKLWEYIKENNLQNPKNKRKIILDDKLKKIFKPPLDMFNMNKQLSKHVYVDGTALLCCTMENLPSAVDIAALSVSNHAEQRGD